MSLLQVFQLPVTEKRRAFEVNWCFKIGHGYGMYKYFKQVWDKTFTCTKVLREGKYIRFAPAK